jgi:hypothetical protein
MNDEHGSRNKGNENLQEFLSLYRTSEMESKNNDG